MIVFEDLGDCGAYEAITPEETATGFAIASYKPISGVFKGRMARAALILIEDNQITMSLLAGTDPTLKAGTNVGIHLEDTVSYVIKGINNIKSAKFINTVNASDGIVKAFLFF